MDFQFELDGVDETTGALERIRNLKRLYAQMTKAVLRVQNKVQKYPTSKGRTRAEVYGVHAVTGTLNGHSVTFMSSFKTFKQHLWFFASLHDGSLTVPYKQSGTLGRKWTTKVDYINGGVVGLVGNVTPYGPLVQDRDQQALFHKGRWITGQDVLDDMANDIFETLAEAFDVEG